MMDNYFPDTNRLDVLAEVASNEQYLRVCTPERLHGNLVSLVEIASKALSMLEQRRGKSFDDKMSGINSTTFDTAGNISDAEDTIIACPLMEEQNNFPLDRPLRSRRKRKPRRAAIKKFSRSTAVAMSDNSSGIGDETDHSFQHVNSPVMTGQRDRSRRCTACEHAGPRARCQIVKKNHYHGACLRCASRGNLEKCSLYKTRSGTDDSEKRRRQSAKRIKISKPLRRESE